MSVCFYFRNLLRDYDFWATVCKKRFALCCRTVVLSVMSVTLLYCGQTVGWIKMKLGMEIGLGPATLC